MFNSLLPQRCKVFVRCGTSIRYFFFLKDFSVWLPRLHRSYQTQSPQALMAISQLATGY